MEGDQIYEATQVFGLPPVPPLNIGIAINGKKNSKSIVNWALQKFNAEEKVVFKLLHVFPTSTRVPTQMGNHLPVSQVRDEVVAAYRQELKWNKMNLIKPYKRICAEKNVQAEIVLIESDDMPKAIAQEITNSQIRRIVIGVSSRGLIKRSRDKKLSSRIAAAIPKSCSIYGISNGKISFVHQSDMESIGSNGYASSLSSEFKMFQERNSPSLLSDHSSISTLVLSRCPSLATQRLQALASINKALHGRSTSFDCTEGPSNSDSTEQLDSSVWTSDSSRFELDVSSKSTSNNLCGDKSWDLPSSPFFTETPAHAYQEYINLELEKLRVELRHARGMYAVAQNEAIYASKRFNDLSKQTLEETERFREISKREEEAMELAREAKERREAAAQKADDLKLMAEKETLQRQDAETKVEREKKEKEKLQNALTGNVQQYRSFSWDEIVSATSSFSDDLKIGMGAYGTVYRCTLHNTPAAVKILRSNELSDTKQFHREIEILSKIRHPHLLILLGACVERGCIVYEYMENGSLDNRLQRVGNTPAIPWKDRFRIALEVASALVFLHSSKPDPVIHRDLKPGNILLDHNLLSKIGDVGLATMLPMEPTISEIYKDTGPVGTLSYMDPEYQRTGSVSTKSDVYAFGIVILQLLTAKAAKGLAPKMETAVHENCLDEILDKDAGNWPVEETMELAKLGLSCAELRRQDRPDLGSEVLPALERLNKLVCNTADSTSQEATLAPPHHFMCPLSKVLMNDPCVAADGHTYERSAIQKWLQENDTSPITNLPLANMDLLPNYTFLSAIMGWKSKIF